MTKKDKNFFAILVAVIAIGAVTYGILTIPDERSTGERVGDAIDSLDEGVDDAARELQSRTPAERIQDGFEDATDGDPE